jgi:uncharacterized delta-60 repeat protein
VSKDRRNTNRTGRAAARRGNALLQPVERLESRTLLANAPVMLANNGFAAASMVELGGNTYFTDYASGFYRTNGTPGGTFLVKRLPFVGAATVAGDRLYFATGNGVWSSDGTAPGTIQVLPFNGQDGWSHAGGFTAMGGDVYFFADTRGAGSGLWKTDGTPAGTSLVSPFFGDTLTAAGATLTAAGNAVYFVGPDEAPSFGKELWKSDGTAAGTVMVRNIDPLYGSMDFVTSEPRPMAALGDKLVFMAHEQGVNYYNPYVTDGTAAGTVRLSADAGAYGYLTNFGGAVYFSGFDAAGHQEVWKTDGTPAGTTLVKELPNQASGYANRMTQLTFSGGALYFVARNGDFRCNLWKTDGTAAGTVVVKGSATGQRWSDIFDPADAGGTLGFIVADADVLSGAYSVWTSDGTTAGTAKLRDTFLGATPGAYGTVDGAGTVLYYTASDGANGVQFWALQTQSPPPVPEARADGPAPFEVDEGGTAALHGYTSAEPLPGRPLTYAWDLDGDDVFGETGAAAARGNETGTDPTFNAAGLDGPGTFPVRFRVSDPTGYASTAAADVHVRNVAPTLNVSGGPATLVQGNPYTLTLSSTDPGPDTIDHWDVDWGDGTTQRVPGAAAAVTHAYPSRPAVYGVTVTASDEDGTYRYERPVGFDNSFGTAGKTIAGGTVSNQLAVQPDGKIVSLSTEPGGFGGSSILVTRFNPDGTLDRAFGPGDPVSPFGGQVRLNPTNFGEDGTSIALQPDGKIVVAGTLSTGSFPFNVGIVLIRLLPDGSLDPSFGGGGASGGPGWIIPPIGGSPQVGRIALTPDGHILAGCNVTQLFTLARFNADGSLDTTFGDRGTVVTDVAANDGGARDLLLQGDGKLLVVPYGYPPVPSFLVMRFNPDGSPDAAFGAGGRATVDFGGLDAVSTSLSLTAGGSILVAGLPHPSSPDAVVARLTPAGALDPTFADGGRLATPPFPFAGTPTPLLGIFLPVVRTTPDGRFLVAATHEVSGNHYEEVVARFLPDGSPDPTFAPTGRFEVDLGGIGAEGLLRDLVVQRDGAPLLYGGSGGAVVRLAPPGLSVRVVDAASPAVSLTSPPATAEATPLTIALSGNDPDGDGIAQWVVNWGDGSAQVVPGSATSATHTYADGPGEYVIKASAIDGDGSIGTAIAGAPVTNVAPVLHVTAGAAAAEGSPFTVQFGATDVGADTVSAWTVEWGDGAVQSYPGNATSAQHAYPDDGSYVVKVSATDEDGTYAAPPVTAAVTNVPPTIDPMPARRAAAGAPLTFRFTARDAVPEVFGGTVNWGDGTARTPFSLAADSPAQAAAFALDHTYAARGTYTVTVELIDGDGGATSATASVRVGDALVTVYDDVNGNATRDPGESGHAGVTAFLDLDGDGVRDPEEFSGTSDAAGEVLFDLVPPPSQVARVVVPPNWHLSTPAAGSAVVTPGGPSAAASFGLTQVASAGGTLFDDADHDGARDAGEGPLSTGVRATRLGGNSVVSTVADADGHYRFTGLTPGRYLIELGAARVVTAPFARRGYVITVTGSEAEFNGLDFGSYAGTGALVTGMVFRDFNASGTRDANDTPLAGRTVYVDANDNGAFDPDEFSAVTGSSGNWSIARLPAGTFNLRQVLPAFWRQTAPAGGDAAARQVTLAEGQRLDGVNFGTTRVPAQVVGRRLFYNRSARDGNNSAANAADDNAIALDKSALLPGGASSFANVSAYSRGINGVMIDVLGLPSDQFLQAADFSVEVPRDNGTWRLAAPPAVTVRRGAGAGGSDRVTLTWPDNAVRNTWLRVTLKVGERTGLTSPDVFYFGHLAGETGGGPFGVDATDLAAVRRSLSTRDPTALARFDFDADGAVNAFDLAVVRSNLHHALAPLTAPATAAAVFSTARVPAAAPTRRGVWDVIRAGGV